MELDSSGVSQFSRHYRLFFYFIQFYGEQIEIPESDEIGQILTF